MSKATADRTGLVVFVGGVACLVLSVAFGFFLAHEAETILSQSGWDVEWWQDARMESAKIRTIRDLLSSVNTLMWMVFGLGACLTLCGLRMLTKPNLDFDPARPLGPIREVFENPE